MELCPRCGAALPEESKVCPVCPITEGGPEDEQLDQLVIEAAAAQETSKPPARWTPALGQRWERLLSTPLRRRLARSTLSLALVVTILLLSVGAWRAFVHSPWGARLGGLNEVVFVGANFSPLARTPTGSTQCITAITSTDKQSQSWNVSDTSNCSSLVFVQVGQDSSSAASYSRGSLYLMRPDGSGLHRLTNVPNGSYFSPVWSPDGAEIAAFVIYPVPGLVAKLVIMNADGSNARLIPSVSLMIGNSNNGFSEVTTPLTRLISWSPDSSQLVAPVGTDQFALINADGANLRQFSGTLPTWSPDGRSLAYYMQSNPTSYTYCTCSIRIMNAQTFQTRDLSNLADVSGSALAWSPDGRFLAYGTIRLDAGQTLPDGALMLARPDGSKAGTVAQWHGGLLEQIAWSPDSYQLAAVVGDVTTLGNGDASNTQRLYIVNTNGSHQRDLGPSDTDQPSWSPDGRHLIYTSVADAAQSSALLLVDTGASPISTQRLALHVPFAFAPSWSPLPGL